MPLLRWEFLGLQDGVKSVGSLPYRFPLRPLAGLGRRAPRGMEPDRQDRREVTGEQIIEFGGAEEMDQQATLGVGQIADGEPAVGVVLHDFVVGPDVGPDRIDPQAEQAVRGDPLLSGADVGVSSGPVAVLEHLDADHERPGRPGWKGAEVTIDQPTATIREAGGELVNGGRGDIKAGKVQPGGNQWQVVAAIAATDVKTKRHARLPSGGNNIAGECHRWLVLVSPGVVLSIPSCGRVAVGLHAEVLSGRASLRPAT
jgi:hypothetical protein